MKMRHMIIASVLYCLYPQLAAGGTFSDRAMAWLLKSGLLFSEQSLFSISYSEGYNINYEISQSEAEGLLPANIKPLKLKLLEDDAEEKYYLSWYIAVMEGTQSINRVDIFTYGLDAQNNKTLYFLSSVMEVPEKIKNNSMSYAFFKRVLNYLARDSRTGKPSYPHYYADRIVANQDHLSVSFNGAKVEGVACAPLKSDQRFSREFVLANSQIYRNETDKNTNYFNQNFIEAPISSLDPNCLNLKNIRSFHPLLAPERLSSVHFYGSKAKQIRWYFEM